MVGSARALSPTKNVLRALWAPILILHLGGPDTITAYTLQDTQLWTRHILTLVVQSFFAIYVIYLSWIYLRLSILTIPLILAGIIKYVERILCLELTSSKKTEPVISESHHQDELEMSIFIDKFLAEHADSIIVVLGYLLFSVMRPDVHDYLSGKLYLRSSQATARVKTYLKGTKFNHQKSVLVSLLERGKLSENPFEIAAAEMGFIFDTVYTKTSLIYTKKGCVLRVISFTCSFSVLMFFLISIINEPKFHFSSVDIRITISLLVGAVALEFFAVYSMFSSHWAIPLILFHENRWVRKILWYVFKYFPRLLFPQRNRWSGRMGQFNLLDYYWNSSNSKVYGFLEKSFSSRILENLHKYNCTRLIESIELDFDISIIVWHLATSICYQQDVHALQPAMLLPESCKSFWLDVCDKLKDLFYEELNMDHALTLLLNQDPHTAWYNISTEKAEKGEKKTDSAIADPLNELLQYALNLVRTLNSRDIWDRWKMIKDMWIEMLLYAAHSCHRVNHIKQLARSDREFLTLIWVMCGSWFIEATKMLEVEEPTVLNMFL
ncbi:hypothetical protein SLEP1_g27865 [Rubroshorea leprosula]|uniref:DUF4220 domain-containing protein n=1 Tax=Rubroshorea leprosula TaxID=152421 RepID=A0AAV5K4F0_9ROSI|nr:hypothetical protein SLEP1_g27865 [Rubroshorea leprosula]